MESVPMNSGTMDARIDDIESGDFGVASFMLPTLRKHARQSKPKKIETCVTLSTGLCMGFKEGMRRLALVLGIIGFILGLGFALTTVPDFIGKWRNQRRFDHLLSSSIVQQGLSTIRRVTVPPGTYHQAVKAPPNADEVKEISFYFDSNPAVAPFVESVTLNSGELIIPESSSPTMSGIILFSLWPIFGFLLGWAPIAIISWIISGFRSIDS